MHAGLPLCLSGEESEDTEEDEEQEDEEDRGEEEEEDDGEEDASPGRKRRRAGADASTSQPSKRGPPGGGGGPADRAAARRERRAAMRQRAELIDNYYNSKNGYGKPSSVVLFALCHQLQHTDYFHVWCVWWWLWLPAGGASLGSPLPRMRFCRKAALVCSSQQLQQKCNRKPGGRACMTCGAGAHPRPCVLAGRW